MKESWLVAFLKRVKEGARTVLGRGGRAAREMLARHRERTAFQRAVFAFILVGLLGAVGLSTGWRLSQQLFLAGEGGVRPPASLFHDEETAVGQASETRGGVEAPTADKGALASAGSAGPGDLTEAGGSADSGLRPVAVEPVEARPAPVEPRIVMAPTESGRPFHPKVDAFPPGSAGVGDEEAPSAQTEEEQSRATDPLTPDGISVPTAVSEAGIEQRAAEGAVVPVGAAEEMVWPVSGSVVRPFGWYRHPVFAEWRHASSTALVVDGDDRTVRAVLAGRVRDVVNEGGFWRVTIEHAGGLTSEYEGLVAIDVHSYASVSTGAPIGVAPDRASGRQIAFALYQDGDPVDPQAYFGDLAAPVQGR